MGFQFLCPQGHLLEGEESQAGQQCECPFCQSQFLIPQPPSAPVAHAGQVVSQQQPHPEQLQPGPAPEQPLPNMGPNVGPAASPEPEAPPFSGLPGGDASVVHIPCPNGHELETPRDMLGQECLCPHCNAQFRLDYRNSREHRREREDAEQRREMQTSKAWMNWAIAVAVVAVLGVITLIAVSASR